MKVKEDKEKIKEIQKDRDTTKTSYPYPSIKDKSYYYVETFNGDVNVDKLYRALKHQVKLCGGTGELF